MVLDAVLSRFIEESPITVMAQVAMQQALEPGWVDELFERHRQRQYTRQLLFSTTVDLMSLVALGLRPSVHAAAQAQKELSVSLAALYDKINNTEPELVRALVHGSAERLGPVLWSMRKPAPLVAGYRIRIIDGNHLPASEKRLKPLRGFRGAALPGQALVVYDPDCAMVVDLIPGEDGHSQERTLMEPVLASAQAGDLWIADRNFSTKNILSGWHGRQAAFIVREHSHSPNPTSCGRVRKVGRIETGVVYEQAVQVELPDGGTLSLRRIELRLDAPTEDGDTVIRVLTNLPLRVKATKIALLYRQRWKIEGMFQRLESVLHSEVRSLGYPRAALFAFGIAVVAYNVLSTLQAAVEQQHQLEESGPIELSSYFIAAEVRASYRGMMIAVADSVWDGYQALSPRQVGQALLKIAAKVEPKTLRKHPRGPKIAHKKGYAPGYVARQHVATARVLADGKLS